MATITASRVAEYHAPRTPIQTLGSSKGLTMQFEDAPDDLGRPHQNRDSRRTPARSHAPRSVALDRLLLAGVVLAVVALTVPLVPAVWSARASLGGLPRSMVWILAVMTWVFLILLLRFRAEQPEGNGASLERDQSRVR